MPPLRIDADGWVVAVEDVPLPASPTSPVDLRSNDASSSSTSCCSSSDAGNKESPATSTSSGWITSTKDIETSSITIPAVEPSTSADDASTASTSARSSSLASKSGSAETSNSSEGRVSGGKDDETSTTASAEPPTDNASNASTSEGSFSGASTRRSTSDHSPVRLRPMVRPPPLPLPARGVDPKLLKGKKLAHIRRSPDHPAVTLSFSDNTTYQILVDGYDPRLNTSTTSLNKIDPTPAPGSASSRACVLEMDDTLLRMLEVPGRHVVDREIADCAHIRLSDKAYERSGFGQTWTQSHVAVAFKFVEERRWHCVWAMRAEYDERGCSFRAFDDVYLQALTRPPPRSPQIQRRGSTSQVPASLQKNTSTGLQRGGSASQIPASTSKSPFKGQSSPQKSPTKNQSSPQKSTPKPPPSPNTKRADKTANVSPNTPKKNRHRRRDSWKKEI